MAPIIECEKRRYPDQISANWTLLNIWAKGQRDRPKMERRVYRCPKCKGYHLTSKEKAA
jgi:hypothetical protein